MSIAKASKGQPAPPTNETALEKGIEALTTLARLLRLDTDRAVAQSGLSQPMASTLGHLRLLSGQATVSELARSIGCNMGNLSVTLDRLEEAGYVERIVSEADRRARLIRLTVKGRRIATQMLERFRGGRVFTALRNLNLQQLETMTEMINRLNEAVKTDASR